MIYEKYLHQDEKTVSDSYHDAGVFSLEEAARLVITLEDGRISPDPSGLWLVTVPYKIDL